ncbi:MAG: winged helix-turn-helix domain-containing protein, partial [Gammaproteobacteria bacterium]|nr:winged helix-turn-helix domain-containing protein [Gammaproteobacteria bacterium]
MARSKPFIVPVCIDDTSESETDAPDSFRFVQWTRLPGGVTSRVFAERILALLRTSGAEAPAPEAAAPGPEEPAAAAGAPQAEKVIRVGAFELIASERQLLRDGQPVELGARAFDLLQVLAEQPGRLVSKATLLERVWPKLVVDENNLPAQVASLRRVLGA